jgi:hypothetical protein
MKAYRIELTAVKEAQGCKKPSKNRLNLMQTANPQLLKISPIKTSVMIR